VWSVWRHGGMPRHRWRRIAPPVSRNPAAGPSAHLDEATARTLYAREIDSMRQGGVQLRDGSKVVLQAFVPKGGITASKTKA
jgi:hypothetical protein